MSRPREFGAVPIPCPNGCGNPAVMHVSPDLLATLSQIATPDDFFVGTGYCRRCDLIVRVAWKDAPRQGFDRAA